MYWFMQALKNYSNFSGRACRSEYNWFQTISGIVVFGLMTAFLYYLLTSITATSLGALTGGFLLGLSLVGFALVAAVPGWAVLVRRLHDIGLNGWWSLLVFVPYCGFLFLVVVGCIDSTRGANRYGPNPKGM